MNQGRVLGRKSGEALELFLLDVMVKSLRVDVGVEAFVFFLRPDAGEAQIWSPTRIFLSRVGGLEAGDGSRLD